MELRPMWSVVVVLECLSRRGDRWVAHAEGNRKVILVDPGYRHKVEAGMTVPIVVDKEVKTCSFGRVETGVWIDGRGAWLDISTDFNDDDVIRNEAEAIKAKWEKEAEKHRLMMEEYRAEQAARKVVVDKLLDLDSRRYTSTYMTRIKKRSDKPLSSEECQTILRYLELPPWGVMDKGDHIITDSYTD